MRQSGFCFQNIGRGTLPATSVMGLKGMRYPAMSMATNSGTSSIETPGCPPTSPLKKTAFSRRGQKRPQGMPAVVRVVSRKAFDAWKDKPTNGCAEADREGRSFTHAA